VVSRGTICLEKRRKAKNVTSQFCNCNFAYHTAAPTVISKGGNCLMTDDNKRHTCLEFIYLDIVFLILCELSLSNKKTTAFAFKC